MLELNTRRQRFCWIWHFHDIVKLLTMRGESKAGLSTYYIKLYHGKNVFDTMLDRIGEMDLNDNFPINIIGFRKKNEERVAK